MEPTTKDCDEGWGDNTDKISSITVVGTQLNGGYYY